MTSESRLERLVAFLDGELSVAESAAVDAELAVDLAFAEEREVFTALDRRVRLALAPLGARDDAIAAAVLARAPAIRRRDALAAGRPWLAVLALAAALLLIFRFFPSREPESRAPWRLARGESAIWVPEGKKFPIEPAAELRVAGDLLTIDRGPVALTDPSGADVLVAPLSALSIARDGARFLDGRIWVRGAAPLPVRVGDAQVDGRGSFAIEARGGLVIVSAIAGDAAVRLPDGSEIALAAGMALSLGGKGGPETMPAPDAILGLAWATGVLEGPAAPGSALDELVRGHLALLRDEKLAGIALKGFSTLGAAAVPSLRDALLGKTESAAVRPRLALALREAVGEGPLPDPLAESLFDLALAVQWPALGDVIDSLAAATGMEPVPDRGFWSGKLPPEERKKAVESWRAKWVESRRRF